MNAMKFVKVLLLKGFVIISVCCLVITCKKNEKKKSGKKESTQSSVPEILTNISDNTTRHFVSQNVKSKKVSCTKDNINDMIRSVRCKPRSTVVELVSGTKNRFIPNAVLAKRCSGSCDGFQRCVGTKTINTTFFVKEIVRNKTFCSVVEIFEDKECSCECLLKPSDCSPYQRYSLNTCTCRCNDDVMFRKCKSSVNKHFEWNERKCACECVGIEACSSGLEWDSNKCRCIKRSG